MNSRSIQLIIIKDLLFQTISACYRFWKVYIIYIIRHCLLFLGECSFIAAESPGRRGVGVEIEGPI